MPRRRRGGDEALNPWPGYVDALSTLLMVIIFVLLVFVLAQAFLSVALTGRDRALDRLNRQVAELTDMLSLERGRAGELQLGAAGLSRDLAGATQARETLTRELGALREEQGRVAAERDGLRAERDRLSARLADASLQSQSAAARNEQLQARVAETAGRTDQAGQEVADLAASLAESRRAQAATLARLNATGAQLAANQASLAEALASLAANQGQLAEARGQILQRQAALDRAVQAGQAATGQLVVTTARLAGTESRLAASVAGQAATGAQLGRLQASLGEAQVQLDAARAQVALARAELERTVQADRATIEARLGDLARLQDQVRALTALRDGLERQAQETAVRVTTEEERRRATAVQLAEQATLGESARAQVALLSAQLAQMRDQLAQLNAALGVARQSGAERDAQIATLGARLNTALASKVEELQRYRSEFFGRLRTVLANRPGIQVVGDRFVFQSEVLFPAGSADLTQAGQDEIRQLATTLKSIAQEIPTDLPWLLRVDGHADRQPTGRGVFTSNWELSAERAIVVVKLLIEEGVPANRLAATGFGEFQPLDGAETAAAYAKNRRIEIRLTDR